MVKVSKLQLLLSHSMIYYVQRKEKYFILWKKEDLWIFQQHILYFLLTSWTCCRFRFCRFSFPLSLPRTKKCTHRHSCTDRQTDTQTDRQTDTHTPTHARTHTHTRARAHVFIHKTCQYAHILAYIPTLLDLIPSSSSSVSLSLSFFFLLGISVRVRSFHLLLRMWFRIPFCPYFLHIFIILLSSYFFSCLPHPTISPLYIYIHIHRTQHNMVYSVFHCLHVITTQMQSYIFFDNHLRVFGKQFSNRRTCFCLPV